MTATAGEVVLTYLRTQRDVIAAREDRVRSDAPDAVHRSRVATRRARSALRTYSRLFQRPRLVQLRTELAWHADHLGAPRDAEVLQARLAAGLERLGADPEASSRLTGELSQLHDQAHRSLVDSMDEPRYRQFRDLLDAFVNDPPLRRRALGPAVAVLPELLRSAVSRVSSLAGRAADLPSDLAHWHEVRKAAKAVRYCAEALVGSLAGVEPLAKAWEAVTEGLGEVQDSVVAEGMLVRVSAAALAEGVPVASFLTLEADELTVRDAALARGRDALAEAFVRTADWTPASAE